MLFNFQTFIEELRGNPEKRSVVEKYESIYGEIEGSIFDQLWYKTFVANFDAISYKVPEELINDFDWELLIKLVGSSFSSEAEIEVDISSSSMHPELIIKVTSGNQTIVKKASEMWGFQILRLYEIYAEEQMNLQTLIGEDEKEKIAINSQRKEELFKWKRSLNTARTEIELNSFFDEIEGE